jgi:hypothetical protein
MRDIAISRRQVLEWGLGGVAVGALGSTPALAQAVSVWGQPDPTIFPANFFPAGKSFYKVLEIHLYGGLSPWETFYHRPISGGLGYRGFQAGADEVVTALNWHLSSGSTPNLCQFAPSPDETTEFTNGGGHPVHFGPATKPLWNVGGSNLLDRTRVVVLQHNLLPHEAAIPYAATGSRLGQPRLAGLGAAVQRRAMAVEAATVGNPAPRTTPWSYVLEPSDVDAQVKQFLP